MRTYFKSKRPNFHRDPANWIDRIKNVTSFDDKELFRMCQDSSDWITCACGFKDERVERDDIGRPIDSEMAHLGERFEREMFKLREHRKDSEIFKTTKLQLLITLEAIDNQEFKIIQEQQEGE